MSFKSTKVPNQWPFNSMKIIRLKDSGISIIETEREVYVCYDDGDLYKVNRTSSKMPPRCGLCKIEESREYGCSIFHNGLNTVCNVVTEMVCLKNVRRRFDSVYLTRPDLDDFNLFDVDFILSNFR